MPVLSKQKQEPEQQLVWSAQPKQEMFIACPCDDVAFGGARGGGKSDAVIGDWITHQTKYKADAVGMVFRRERVQLGEFIERAKQILIPQGYSWRESPDKYFRGPTGSRLRFTYLESDSDADNYQGHSYTRLYPEEIGTFPREAPVAKLSATLRSGAGVPCQMKGTCNPGGAGHGWVRMRYGIDKYPNGNVTIPFEFENPYTGSIVRKTRIFIPSRVTDNKFLGDEYVANLFLVGSDKLVRAWLEGDWNAVEGAFFDEFTATTHVLRAFQIPASWTRFRALDWGSAHPFCVLWVAVAGDDHVVKQNGRDIVIPRGALVVYREWYGSRNHDDVGLKLTADEVAEGILKFEQSEPRAVDGRDGIAYGVAGGDIFANNGGPSIAERMGSAPYYVMWGRADDTRIARSGRMGGWDLVRERLRGEGGRPMLYIFANCEDLIRTLPALQHDDARPEDLDTDSEDHAADCLRYACASRPYVSRAKAVEAPRGLVVGGESRITLGELFADYEKKQSWRSRSTARL
jgi:hypothetical protein